MHKLRCELHVKSATLTYKGDECETGQQGEAGEHHDEDRVAGRGREYAVRFLDEEGSVWDLLWPPVRRRPEAEQAQNGSS